MLLTQSFGLVLTLLLYLRDVTAQVYDFPTACYYYVDEANLIVQSVGLDYNQLCASTGDFSHALQAVTSCMAANSGSGDRVVATLLDSAQAYCASSIDARVLSSYTSSFFRQSICCGTDTGAQLVASCPTLRTYVASNDANCAQYIRPNSTITSASPANATAIGNATAQSGQSITSTAAFQSSGASPTASPSASSTSVAQPSKTNTGLIVGAAVGASLGFVILVLTTFFFFWHRRQRRRNVERANAAAQAREPEKAQLHSDDLRPDPKELPGAPVVMVRSVGGLEEMEARQWRGHEISTSQSVEQEWTSTGSDTLDQSNKSP